MPQNAGIREPFCAAPSSFVEEGSPDSFADLPASRTCSAAGDAACKAGNVHPDHPELVLECCMNTDTRAHCCIGTGCCPLCYPEFSRLCVETSSRPINKTQTQAQHKPATIFV